MMFNGVESRIHTRSRCMALAHLLLLTVIIFNHETASQATQQRKSKSRVIVAAKDIPQTSFSCDDRSPGYYADVETGCQVYHMCSDGGTQFSYRCPNTTLFQQRMLICAHWYQVNCSRSEQHFSANLLIGQRDKPFVDDSEHVNIYYHGKDLKKLLNPEELQSLQHAKSTAINHGLQVSASEHIKPSAGVFSNFQRPRMDNNFTHDQTRSNAIRQETFNYQPGKSITQFTTASNPTIPPFQNSFKQPINSFQSVKSDTQFTKNSNPTIAPFQNSFKPTNSFQSGNPQIPFTKSSNPTIAPFQNNFKPINAFQSVNPDRQTTKNSNPTIAPFQNNFKQQINSFQSHQPQSTSRPNPPSFNHGFNQERLIHTSTPSTPVPFNTRTNPSSFTQSPLFHPSNQHTVAHFSTQSQFHISPVPFTNQPQVFQSPTPDKFTPSPFQTNSNQNSQVKNINFPTISQDNIVSKVPLHNNHSQNTESPPSAINENTYNNFIRRFMPDEDESKKIVNESTTTNEYNQFLKVFVPDESFNNKQDTSDSTTNYNNFLKVFVPDESNQSNTNNNHRQNSKVSASNFISQINSLSKDIEPPIVSINSELDLPFDDADLVESSMELFKLKIPDPRHAFFIPDNDNEQIPLDSQVTPVTITIHRPSNSRPHPMTFLNIVPGNCYRCHPNFIVDKEACTPCVVIR